MPKAMQNVVLLIDPPYRAYDISLKAGNMYLNRLCIDEDAAFESSGVNYLSKYTNSAEKGQRNNIHNTDCFFFISK